MAPKRLVLFVEGQGDVEAVPVLVNRILSEINPWDYLYLDPRPFRVGGPEGLTGKKRADWVRLLRAAAKRRGVGGVEVASSLV